MIDHIDPIVWKWTIDNERDERVRRSLRNPHHAVRCYEEAEPRGWLHAFAKFFTDHKEPRNAIASLD
jgi:hypothetical protein